MFLSLLLEWHSRQVPFSLLAKKVVPQDFLDAQMLVTDSWETVKKKIYSVLFTAPSPVIKSALPKEQPEH